MESVDKYATNLKGARVILVGGGSHFDLDIIEGYDVAVRCNLHRVLHQGGKCDVLYTRTGIPGYDDLSKVDALHLKWLIIEQRKAKIARRLLSNSHSEYDILYTEFGGTSSAPQDRAEPLSEETQLPFPLMGMIALNHLLKFPLKELHITGMDFYKKTPKVELPRNYMAHDPDKHLEWLVHKVATDGRITLDPTLSEVVFQGGDKPI